MPETVNVGARAGDPLVPRVAHVKRRRREVHDTWTLELEGGSDGETSAPGQFYMLYALGVGEIPVSVSGDPETGRQLHTIRAVGPVSTALTGLKRGSALGVRGPFGSTWPLESAAGRDVVVMAGGLGLAPLRPLLYRLLARPSDYGRISLLYGARSPAEILYQRELDRWRDGGRARIDVTVDHAAPDWDGQVGVVTDLVKADLFEPGNAVAFLCGPEVMMRFSVNALMDLGLPAGAIHVSMERNMKCAVGHCGHCQLGPAFVCKDGPVFRYDRLAPFMNIREF